MHMRNVRFYYYEESKLQTSWPENPLDVVIKVTNDGKVADVYTVKAIKRKR